VGDGLGVDAGGKAVSRSLVLSLAQSGVEGEAEAGLRSCRLGAEG
jgi:hypothetical protein